MIKPTRIAVDMASVLWTAMRTGKDPEGRQVEHEGTVYHVNTAEHAYEMVMNSINAVMTKFRLTPRDLVLALEGMSSKRRRLLIDQNYKLSRKSKPPEENAQYQRLLDMVFPLLRGLGAIGVTQDGVEGDDILGYLAHHAEEPLVIHTFDNDLMALHGLNSRGVEVMVHVKGDVGFNKYGDFPHRLITTYKALVGDDTDNIKGCVGFGPAKFIDLVAKYGEDGLAELQDVLESGSLAVLETVPKCPLIDMILKQADQVLKCYKLAKIHPEWVDTRNQPLQWLPGMVTGECNDERFRSYRQQKRLVTRKNIVHAYEFLKSKLAETKDFAFDIETSSAPESDEWLEAQGNPDGVDVIGSSLTGFSLTFGANQQYTYYVSVDHADTENNIDIDDARMVLELVQETGKPLVIQNTSFEGAVLYLQEEGDTTWGEIWKDNGYHGFLCNWLDTKFEANYVNENMRVGLKERSKFYLGYDQKSYAETTQKTGKLSELPPGGRIIKELAWIEESWTPTEDGEPCTRKVLDEVVKQYKMNELRSDEVFDYGADDTITTSSLHNFYKLHMQLDHHWQVYLDVEIDASYQHAKNFTQGKNFSLETMKEQEKEDDATYADAWAVVSKYLISKGWDGTVPPTYGTDITAKQIKEAYGIVTGQVEEDEADEGEEVAPAATVKDAIMSSRVRTPAKFVPLLKAEGHEMFAQALEACLASPEGAEAFTLYVRQHFSGEPVFKLANRHMSRLLYDVMQMPVRVYNKPTVKMREQGIKQGTPMANALAVKYALLEGDDEQVEVLKGLQLMQMVQTRRGLYYKPYPGFIHWKTGKIHSSHNQCATNTRRASSSSPNDQQQPKNEKIEGQKVKFRRCTVPHKKGAVIVSMDESQQELRLMAEFCQDTNLLSCYVGENLKDMHALTGVKIANKRYDDLVHMSYDDFILALGDKEHPDYQRVKTCRSLAKPVNFGDQYGAMAGKIAQLLLIAEGEAQDYLDAKEEAFPGIKPWKARIMEEAQETGKAYTLLGAVRHLAEALNSDDRMISSKADRQAVSFRIQGSGAEMLKRAEGAMWRKGLTQRFDAVCYGPVHDEVVFSVMLDDLIPFLMEAHPCMVQPYGNMKVPIVSEVSIGWNFGEQLELGSVMTPEIIAEGVKKLYEELEAA